MEIKTLIQTAIDAQYPTEVTEEVPPETESEV